jgi:hypothetical protein
MKKKMATKCDIMSLSKIADAHEITAEEAWHVDVMCKNLHVVQPEVGINISLSDENDNIEFSVFC